MSRLTHLSTILLCISLGCSKEDLSTPEARKQATISLLEETSTKIQKIFASDEADTISILEKAGRQAPGKKPRQNAVAQDLHKHAQQLASGESSGKSEAETLKEIALYFNIYDRTLVTMSRQAIAYSGDDPTQIKVVKKLCHACSKSQDVLVDASHRFEKIQAESGIENQKAR